MAVFEINDLHKRYGAREVVRGLSLSVERGEVYGLLGPNGSGKTTTLSCALGLLRPTRGGATVLGEPANRLARTRGRLGVVFDSAIALPALTARQNLAYVRKILGHDRGRDAAEVLRLVELEEYAHQRVRALSLGQQKRLAIAGALLGEPQLIVLDEPLSGLDTMAVRGMLRLFDELRGEGLTLVLSSHRLHEMQTVITHAGILFEGRIARGGALDELLGRGAGHYSLGLAPAGEARALLEAREGVTLERAEERGGRLDALVTLDGLAPERLARELVERGVDLFHLEEHVATLQSVFEGIVDGGAEVRAS